MKHHKRRPRGSGEEVENLKGRIRTLEKLVDNQKRHIKSLEKQVKRAKMQDENFTAKPKKQLPEPIAADDKANSCPQCGSPHYENHAIWTPTGESTWLICQDCKYKERLLLEKK